MPILIQSTCLNFSEQATELALVSTVDILDEEVSSEYHNKITMDDNTISMIIWNTSITNIHDRCDLQNKKTVSMWTVCEHTSGSRALSHVA